MCMHCCIGLLFYLTTGLTGTGGVILHNCDLGEYSLINQNNKQHDIHWRFSVYPHDHMENQ
jgi:hypothetical protein